MRAILAGGGTGGHVIPALAIAQQLQQDYNAEVLFIGTVRGIETRLVPKAGFTLKLVQVGALKNVTLATRFKTLFDLPRAVLAAGRILSEFRADVVIGVGGYASGPAMLAAVLKRVPTLAFEPNVVPGFANRAVARMVSAAAVHFTETARFFRYAEVTGVPVRQAFFEIAPAPHQAPTLLVFGGSQGAHAINQVMMESVADLRARVPGIRIVHQTGERDYSDAVVAYSKSGGAPDASVLSGTVEMTTTPATERRENIAHGASLGLAAELRQAPEGRNTAPSLEVFKFIDDMPRFFANADLLVCRSGASTVAEITAAGRPAIFVPFPRAADDHQKSNAEALERVGAAIMLEEANLTKQSLVAAVTGLLHDPAKLKTMADAARRLSHPNAARDIAAMAAKLAGKTEFRGSTRNEHLK